MDVINQLLASAMVKWPVMTTIIMVIGVLRACVKPAMSLLQAYVLATPSKSDDEFVANFQSGKIYRAIAWFIDYVSSIKLPVNPPPK